MAYRITEKHLNAKIDTLNRMTGNPETPWRKREDGKPGMSANIGNFHLSGAYGGVSLHQMQTDGGGVRDVFSCGHIPKRQLADRIDAYMTALRDVQQ